MSEADAQRATRVVPLMRYRDLPKAITWLSDAFGFDVHYTASDDEGKLIYAQMVYGNGMVMLGPVRDSDFDDLLSQPDEIGGTETQSCYLVVEDVENHYARAKEAGAEIALEVQSDETGGRAYSCRDHEGHLWNFGTFNPWQSATGSSKALMPVSKRVEAGPISMARSAAAVFAGLAIAGVAIGIYSNHQEPQDRISNMRVVDPESIGKPEKITLPTAPIHVVSSLRKKLQEERRARREAEQRLANTRRELAVEKAKSTDSVAVTRRVQEELVEARGAEQAALSTIERLRAQHLREQRLAKASVEDLQSLIAQERAAKAKALKAAEEIKYELVLERQLREQAERNAKAAAKAATTAQKKLKSAKASPEAPIKPVAPPAKVMTSKPPLQKVTAVKPEEAKTDAKDTKVVPEAAPAPKKTVTKKPVRKKVVRRKPKPKKAATKKKPRSNGISKGWPYDTW